MPRAHRPAIARGDLVCGGVLLLLWLTVWVSRLQGPIDLRWDASTYYVLGTSLAEGKGYRLLNEPGEIEAVQYPPLVPALVAVSQRAMGTRDVVQVGSRLRLIYFVLSGLYLLGAYLVMRTLLEPQYALVGTTLLGLSFYSFLYPSDSLYAETPFALVSMLFLLCHRRSERRSWAAATGVLGAVAYLLRTAGIALLGAWVAESLLQRRFRQAALRALAAAIPVLLWQAHVSRVTGSPEYHRVAYPYQRAPYYYSNVTYAENSRLADPFRPELGLTSSGELVGRITRNLLAIPRSIGESSWVASSSGPLIADKLHRELKLPLPADWRALSTSILLWMIVGAGLLVLAGGVLVTRNGERFLPLYFALSIGMIVLTPWPSQFWRYLAPLTPLSVTFLITALLAIGRRLGPVATAPLALMLLIQAVVASGFLRTLLPITYWTPEGEMRSYAQLTYEPAWHALDPALEYVRRHAAPDQTVATSVPHLAYLRTGRKAVLPPLEPDVETASHHLDAVPVTFLVLDELGLPGISERYAAPVVARHPDDWRLVYGTPGAGVRVYERAR